MSFHILRWRGVGRFSERCHPVCPGIRRGSLPGRLRDGGGYCRGCSPSSPKSEATRLENSPYDENYGYINTSTVQLKHIHISDRIHSSQDIFIPSCFQKLKYAFLKAYLVLCPVNQPLMRLAVNETQASETKCTETCWTNYTRRVELW